MSRPVAVALLTRRLFLEDHPGSGPQRCWPHGRRETRRANWRRRRIVPSVRSRLGL